MRLASRFGRTNQIRRDRPLSAGYQRRARRLRRTPSGPQRPVRRITQRYAELIHV